MPKVVGSEGTWVIDAEGSIVSFAPSTQVITRFDLKDYLEASELTEVSDDEEIDIDEIAYWSREDEDAEEEYQPTQSD